MLIILGGRGEKEQKEEGRLGGEIEKGGKRSVQFAHYVELYKACTFYI